MTLYPLKFEPVFCYRIWGGNKLRTVLNKNYTEASMGESWEVSGVKGFETKVSNGPFQGRTLKHILVDHGPMLLGEKVFERFGYDFPLLIKFIDACAPLSIQVHPNDELAMKRHHSFGKNEMWYIIEADEEAEIIVGFDKPMTKEEYADRLSNGTFTEVLHKEKVSKGDTFHIPAGRVHAIGAGVLVAEIQQTSDITYRIWDYDRIDSKTNMKRKLHSELAMDAIDFSYHNEYKTRYGTEDKTSCKLVHTPYFKTDMLIIKREIERDYSDYDSFVIYMCVQGEAKLIWDQKTCNLTTGETILIPAEIKQLSLKATNAKILEVYI